MAIFKKKTPPANTSVPPPAPPAIG
jgi:hypothetical protein